MIFDCDGTITEHDVVDIEILDNLLKIAGEGVQIDFISGRDFGWLEKHLIQPLISKNPNDEILAMFSFYGELGACHLGHNSRTPIIEPRIRDHRLVQDSNLRRRIAALFVQPLDLESIGEDEDNKPGYYPVSDANKNLFWFPVDLRNPRYVFVDFIYSEAKQAILTAEVIRDRQGVPSIKTKQIDSAAEVLRAILEYWKIRDIAICSCRTAVDFIPILDGIILDKSWASGCVLKQTSNQTGISKQELASNSIAFGDGISDFAFSRALDLDNPGRKLSIPFVYVGGEEIPSSVSPDEIGNTVIKAAEGYQGPTVTKSALKYLGLWDC